MAERDNTAGGFSALFSDNYLTVPNVLTCTRILLVMPFVLMFLCENYKGAFTVLALSGLTDFLDGYIARAFNSTSCLGKYLDPLADKITLFAVGCCMAVMYPQLIPIIALLVLKEFLMIMGAVLLLCRSVNPPSAKWYGKAATVMFYVSALSSSAMCIFDVKLSFAAYIMFVLTLLMMIASLIGYYKTFKELLIYT